MNFDRMRALLLDQAIRGELVPQLAKEGVVKQIGALPTHIPHSIPVSWKWVQLPEVVYFQEGPGILKVDFHESGIPLIRISGMSEEYVTLEGCNYLDPAKVEEKWKHFRLDIGDVLISSSASLDRVSKVGEEAKGAIPYTGLIRFKSKGFINLDYFILFVKSQCFIDQINKNKTGTTIKHFGPTHLKKMVIPVPPLLEQARIAYKLDAAFAEIDRAEKAYQELQTLSSVLRGQILQEAIQGKLVQQLASESSVSLNEEVLNEAPFAIPDTWGWIKVEELSAKRKTIEPSTLTNKEVELWSIPAYDAGVANKVSPREIGSSKKVVQVGDVLLAKIVPHIERVWVVSESDNSLMKLASTEWLVYVSDVFLPEFMALLFRTPYFRTKMMESVSGMGSLKRANPRTLAKVWLPVPPLKEQKRIVVRVEELLKQVDSLSAR